ncbi:hypothetical protein Cs7R123_31810 [Catellatospora sp. TT07R-123]|uniref:hypothetical protein n=1 Tax=Catellatospora sp. TT07R-123 TaxID=2733863 RepID=UPI001B0F3744|nr:hypothetical protein [Catellatospora sp. TT07R-123]GHJ45839.1 hypothetical protein Cs7R123_31810 [Catellatospora sp. TT07R-123]
MHASEFAADVRGLLRPRMYGLLRGRAPIWLQLVRASRDERLIWQGLESFAVLSRPRDRVGEGADRVLRWIDQPWTLIVAAAELLVKGICDWGQGKSDEAQELAAGNAASLVLDLVAAGRSCADGDRSGGDRAATVTTGARSTRRSSADAGGWSTGPLPCRQRSAAARRRSLSEVRRRTETAGCDRRQ